MHVLQKDREGIPTIMSHEVPEDVILNLVLKKQISFLALEKWGKSYYHLC